MDQIELIEPIYINEEIPECKFGAFRTVSEGLYFCDDQGLLNELPRRLADRQRFISYRELQGLVFRKSR